MGLERGIAEVAAAQTQEDYEGRTIACGREAEILCSQGMGY